VDEDRGEVRGIQSTKAEFVHLTASISIEGFIYEE
jgi:hypothetical protein